MLRSAVIQATQRLPQATLSTTSALFVVQAATHHAPRVQLRRPALRIAAPRPCVACAAQAAATGVKINVQGKHLEVRSRSSAPCAHVRNLCPARHGATHGWQHPRGQLL
jgi:hypothetical protein